MSIIEKAVGKAGRGARPAAQPPAVRPPGPESRPQAGREHAVELAQASDYDMRQFAGAEQLQREFRFLKRPLLARVFGLSRSGAKPGGLVMITSCMPQAGKTFISFNLAQSIAAEQMTSVVLIDADPIRRRLSEALGEQERPGLTDLLADDSLSLDELLADTDLDSLQFLPAGSRRADATELLAGRRMDDVLADLSRRPDLVVLLDSPPVLLTSEARALAEKIDHVVLVLAAGETGAAELNEALQMLTGIGASVSVVLNKARVDSRRYRQEYYEY
ncbi:MAG: hypothetical protein D6727_00890 [Gammaproteobacteria bacterium]|nr:MAG: hypothetical protein D6727_00890 [Gammaproteobacteria bacterium]